MQNPLGFLTQDIEAYEREAMRMMLEEAAEARLDTAMLYMKPNPSQVTVTEVL